MERPFVSVTMRAIRGVIFDLDGVLTDSAELHYLAWRRLGEEMGVQPPDDLKDAVRGLSRRESLARLLGAREVSEDEADRLMERKNLIYLQLVDLITPADTFAGVVPLLEALRQSGVQAAIASSSRNAVAVLDRLDLLHLIDVICDGSMVHRGKPAPDIFLCAAVKMGLKPRECVVVEDADVGIQAAKAAGMRALRIGRSDQRGDADAVFASVGEIRLADLLGTD
jgi:kojibiose phosphorylase